MLMLTRTATLCLIVVAAGYAGAQANHLLLSEIGIDPVFENTEPVSQYVEIFNPTTANVSLDNYFLADTNLYTSVTLTSLVDTGISDNIIAFPTGHTLAPGQLAVVTHNGNRFIQQSFAGNLADYTSLQGTPLLFEVENSRNDIADMISYNTPQPTPSNQLNLDLAKAREFVVLFHWDSATPLVQDVDVVAWTFGPPGDGDTYIPKGPHIKGANGSEYLPDNGNHGNLSVSGHTLIKTRISIDEFEASGGNGITGHDESTEYVNGKWIDYESHRKSPGLTDLVHENGNNLPVFGLPTRTPKNPSSADSIVLSASASDSDGTIAQVMAYVDTGSGFAPIIATPNGEAFSVTLNPLPDDTIVKYYYEAVDNQGGIRRLPKFAPLAFETFIIDNTPLMPGDVVINEIMHSHVGPDIYEFVELYNTRSTPVNLAYFTFWDDELETFVLPESVIIPGNGFLVITMDTVALNNVFDIPNEVVVLDWGRFSLGLPDRISIADPNNLEFGSLGFFYQQLYLTNQSPWPTHDWNAGNKSLELTSPGGSWAVSSGDATPGRTNSVHSHVRDWALY